MYLHSSLKRIYILNKKLTFNFTKKQNSLMNQGVLVCLYMYLSVGSNKFVDRLSVLKGLIYEKAVIYVY